MSIIYQKTVVKRYSQNPILSSADAPYNSDQIYNAGVTKFNGKYVMIFRNDWGDTLFQENDWGVHLGFAFSDDGLNWKISHKVCLDIHDDEIKRVYDPRLTVIDGLCYVCFAVDTLHGIRGGIAVTEDFNHFKILSLSAPDNRNMVLFPEKINGKFARFERPFALYNSANSDVQRLDMWYSESPDARFWGNTQLVLAAHDVAFCNSKIGPGAPPIKTAQGWLALFHAVHDDPTVQLNSLCKTVPWTKVYSVGVMLLDLDEPYKILKMCPHPIMVPEKEFDYEINGIRGSVLFPTGCILEEDGEVKIYYGASDTVMALGFTTINQLLDVCEPI